MLCHSTKDCKILMEMCKSQLQSSTSVHSVQFIKLVITCPTLHQSCSLCVNQTEAGSILILSSPAQWPLRSNIYPCIYSLKCFVTTTYYRSRQRMDIPSAVACRWSSSRAAAPAEWRWTSCHWNSRPAVSGFQLKWHDGLVPRKRLFVSRPTQRSGTKCASLSHTDKMGVF